MVLIDTHCHIHDATAFPDPSAVLKRAEEHGVARVIVVGVHPDDWLTTEAFVNQHEQAYMICGWHPNYTANYDPVYLPRLVRALQHPKCLALGEIGLDYHWDYSPPTVQHRALRDQLKMAREMQLPVVFHAREAYSDLLDVLEKQDPHPYLFHCFTGTAHEARRALRLGAMFGADGPVTYKSADELRKTFTIIPPHKIVIETDSPYMPPVPHRGKSNEPAYCVEIARQIAALHEMTLEELAEQSTQNAVDFFGPRLVSGLSLS